LKVEYAEETSVRKSLSFEIEAEVVEKEIESRAKEYARKAKLPGFRPGKVPPEVIKRRFRSQVLEDVAEALVNKVVFEELEGRGLRPLASPKVTDLKMDENQPMTFRAVFETLPLVEVPEYRGLQADARTVTVSEEEVDKELERLREEAARFDPVEDRPLALSDFAMVDLVWRPVDGGKGGRDENALIEIGGEGNHPKLKEALEGMSVGETREARLDYPEDHPQPSLAGKSLDYTVTLKAIKVKVLPALDDEFAKDLGDWTSLEELRGAVRERLRSAEERKIDREVKEALIDALVERASFEVPEALVERHMNARTEGAVRSLAYQGIDPTKVGIDWREYRDKQREAAVKAAKADILLDEIARREGIDALPAEVDAEVARYAERMRSSVEAVRGKMEKEGELGALRARIREEKTLDLLKANARLEFK
jgi:trigger factor